MTGTSLANLYRDYIDCLNQRDIDNLGKFVHDDVRYNGELIGLLGYCNMLRGDFENIPDLLFRVELLIADTPYLASRLLFNCTPRASFLGLQINGKKVSFTENVFYKFSDSKIRNVWSIIDKAALETQLLA